MIFWIQAFAFKFNLYRYTVLEPAADGFRNFYNATAGAALRSPGHALIDKASTLRLTVPETVALIG